MSEKDEVLKPRAYTQLWREQETVLKKSEKKKLKSTQYMSHTVCLKKAACVLGRTESP